MHRVHLIHNHHIHLSRSPHNVFNRNIQTPGSPHNTRTLGLPSDTQNSTGMYLWCSLFMYLVSTRMPGESSPHNVYIIIICTHQVHLIIYRHQVHLMIHITVPGCTFGRVYSCTLYLFTRMPGENYLGRFRALFRFLACVFIRMKWTFWMLGQWKAKSQ